MTTKPDPIRNLSEDEMRSLIDELIGTMQNLIDEDCLCHSQDCYNRRVRDRFENLIPVCHCAVSEVEALTESWS